MIDLFREIWSLPVLNTEHDLVERVPSPQGIHLPAWWLREEFPELCGDQLPAPLDRLVYPYNESWYLFTPAVGSAEWIINITDRERLDELSLTRITARDLFLGLYLRRHLRVSKQPAGSRWAELLFLPVLLFIVYAGLEILMGFNSVNEFRTLLYIGIFLVMITANVVLPWLLVAGGMAAAGSAIEAGGTMEKNIRKLQLRRPAVFFMNWNKHLIQALKDADKQVGLLIFIIPTLIYFLVFPALCVTIIATTKGAFEVILMACASSLPWLLIRLKSVRRYAERLARISTRLHWRRFERLYERLRALQRQAIEEGVSK